VCVLLLQPKYIQTLNIIVGFNGVSMLILVLILEDGTVCILIVSLIFLRISLFAFSRKAATCSC
jgi:hypothetical protein